MYGNPWIPQSSFGQECLQSLLFALRVVQCPSKPHAVCIVIMPPPQEKT